MKLVIRSLMMAVVTFFMVTGIAAAQCAPAGCKPKAAGCTPQAKGGCSPHAAMKNGPAKHKTLVGIVSDTACGAKHTMMPGKSDAECTRACTSKGSKFALVVGKKVYTLEGQSEELNKLAGEKAKVSGMVSGDVVQVSTVAPAKKKHKKS